MTHVKLTDLQKLRDSLAETRANTVMAFPDEAHNEKHRQHIVLDFKAGFDACQELMSKELSIYKELVDKMKAALEFVSMPITSSNPSIIGLLDTIQNDTDRAKQILAEVAEIEKGLK